MLTKLKDKPAVTGMTAWHRVAAFFAGFLVFVFLVSETIVMVSYAAPALAATLWQSSGISMDRTLPIGDFAMSDAIVIMMLWGAPFLVMCIVVGLCQWKIMAFLWRHVVKFIKLAFARPGRPAAGREGDGSL